jgi:hypothetical protein
MPKRFGRKPKGPEVVAYGSFLSNARDTLAMANDAEVSFDETLSAARGLAEKIELIHAGKVEVRPPVAVADLDMFAEGAGTIIALGEKATASLTQLESSSRSAQTQGAYSGTGTEPKT